MKTANNEILHDARILADKLKTFMTRRELLDAGLAHIIERVEGDKYPLLNIMPNLPKEGGRDEKILFCHESGIAPGSDDWNSIVNGGSTEHQNDCQDNYPDPGYDLCEHGFDDLDDCGVCRDE